MLCACITPAAFAEETWQWTTPTPGTVNVAAATGPVIQETQTTAIPLASVTLIVNEVFAKGSDTKGEFVELYNYGKEQIDASGLILANHAGKNYILPAGSIIEAGAYTVLQGVLPIADGGDTISLLRGSEELDEMEFTAALIKDGTSAGRYCDVYELRFCETKTSAPTPGAANVQEALKVWAEPADGKLRPGQQASFMTNSKDARILLSPFPGSGRTDDAKLYGGPFTVDGTATFWYYAQFQGQATVPQKITFTVDPTAPSEEQVQNAKGLSISEVMVDSLSKTGWVEVYNHGNKTATLDAVRIDTRAKHEDNCSACLTFSGTNKVFPGAYALLELPRATVSQLLSRQTPIQVRLVLSTEVLDSLEVPLAQQPAQWMSWIRMDGAFQVQPSEDVAAWTDMPTPGVKNIFLVLANTVEMELTPQILGRSVYAQAAYDETKLLLRGKALPGYTLNIFGNGGSLAEVHVAQDGTWEASLPYAQTKDITHLFFRLTSGTGTIGLLSAPFPVPAFDGADPRKATEKKIMSASKTSTAKTAANVLHASPTTPPPFSNLPLLSSMSGTVLQPAQEGYVIETSVIASIPDNESPSLISFLARATDAFLATMLFGSSR